MTQPERHSSAAIIRPYQIGDEIAINDSFNRVFGLCRPLADWLRKFATPWQPEKFISLALQQAANPASPEVVAQFATLPLRMQCDGALLLGAQGVDAFSMPHIRTTRLYPRTVEHFFAHFVENGPVEYVYGFAGTRNTQLLVRHHHFQTTQQAPLWQRSHWPWRYRLPLPAFGLRVQEGFSAELHERLWHACRARYRFCTIRDALYYQYRFPAESGLYRHFVCIGREGPQAGVVVRELHGLLTVVDWLWDGADSRAIDLLERALYKAFPSLLQQQMWLGGDAALQAHLARRDWQPAPLPHPNHLITRWRASAQPPAAAAQPYLTMADADLA
jgi:hypothetical protein